MRNTTPSPTPAGRKPRATKAEMLARRAAKKLAPLERNTMLPAMVKERHAVYAERMAALKQGVTLHTPTRICNLTSRQVLDPARHTASQVLRPGADDHRQYKSLGTGGRA